MTTVTLKSKDVGRTFTSREIGLRLDTGNPVRVLIGPGQSTWDPGRSEDRPYTSKDGWTVVHYVRWEDGGIGAVVGDPRTTREAEDLLDAARAAFQQWEAEAEAHDDPEIAAEIRADIRDTALTLVDAIASSIATLKTAG